MDTLPLDGAIVVNKEEGWTSHDVVNKLRRLAGTKRAGHLGTLDPIATGVLPILIGRATRLSQFYTRADKVYDAIVRFGWSTDTYDRSGVPTSENVHASLDPAELERLLERFRGEFLQTPPPVSAKKIRGRRAYKLARQSVAVQLEPVRVQVYELVLLAVNGAEATIRVHCSGGTYLRSIAHDLGKALGCGAHLKNLRRTASGEFDIAQARTMAELEALVGADRLRDALIPMADLVPALPSVYVDEVTAEQIRHGRNFAASPFRSQPYSRQVKAISRQRELIAIGEAILPNVYHPVIVL